MMKNTGFWTAVYRFLRSVVFVDGIIVALTGIFGWKAGWTSMSEFGTGLQIAGLVAIGIGLLGVKGNWDATRSFEYQYSLSSTDQSSLERTQRALIDFAQSYVFLLVMLLAGGLSLLIGWLL